MMDTRGMVTFAGGTILAALLLGTAALIFSFVTDGGLIRLLSGVTQQDLASATLVIVNLEARGADNKDKTPLPDKQLCVLSKVGITGSQAASCAVEQGQGGWVLINRSSGSGTDADCAAICFDLALSR